MLIVNRVTISFLIAFYINLIVLWLMHNWLFTGLTTYRFCVTPCFNSVSYKLQVFATPETLIGFHPDAGASFYLSHLPGHLGMHVVVRFIILSFCPIGHFLNSQMRIFSHTRHLPVLVEGTQFSLFFFTQWVLAWTFASRRPVEVT